ncbi:MAG: hypothetical protein C4326_10045 [Ignavibacteria bacterium]
MRSLFVMIVREAALIAFAAVLLGFGYGFVMKKGLFAPTQPTSNLPVAPPAPTFIDYEEALRCFREGSALFVDARHEYDYKLGHIRGAINVPLKDFDLATSPLAPTPKNQLIVTYCDGAECNSSIELAQKLAAAGFTNVKMFFGGWNEWQQHHLPTE